MEHVVVLTAASPVAMRSVTGRCGPWASGIFGDAAQNAAAEKRLPGGKIGTVRVLSSSVSVVATVGSVLAPGVRLFTPTAHKTRAMLPRAMASFD